MPVARKKAIALLAALALAGCGGGEARRTGPINPKVLRSLESVHVSPAAAAAMVSAWRQSHGLEAVRLDPALNAMAQRQADAMVAANEMSHDVGGSFHSRLAAAGINASEAGENLGEGYYSTDEAMRAWQDSPGHNANLLLAKATRFGIALAKDPRTEFRTYWAMEIAADPVRAPDAARLQIAPADARQ
jgi:uncharacterized protein YkwD